MKSSTKSANRKPQSQVDRVLNYLAENPGKRTITPAIAANRFGVVNIRSVMTKIRNRVSGWTSADWYVDATTSPRGVRHYSLRRG